MRATSRTGEDGIALGGVSTAEGSAHSGVRVVMLLILRLECVTFKEPAGLSDFPSKTKKVAYVCEMAYSVTVLLHRN